MRKLVALAFFILSLSVSGCIYNNTSHVGNYQKIIAQSVEVDRTLKKCNNYTIKSKDYYRDVEISNIYTKQENINKIKEDGKLRMLSQSEINKKIKEAIGYFFVEVKSYSISKVSNNKYWEVILLDKNDNIISRKKGPSGTAINVEHMWLNIIGVELPKKVENEFKVFVIDTISSKRYEFVITRNN